MTLALRSIPIGQLHDHPQNPRRSFDELKLAELTESVREKGILNPLLVRPNADGFEILAGARRFRAAKMAGLDAVPAIVRELDDAAALEVVVVDNLQRDDLHPFEEAEGYAALMKAAGYDVDAIAQKISKSAKYVYDRVKLLQLIPELRTVFLDGEISAGHAILLARLQPSDQKRALSSTGNSYQLGGLFQHEQADRDPGLELDDKPRRKAVSVRELDTWINDHVRFKPDEVDLPNLFPATAVALEAAREEELKVVKITRDYRVPDAARDEKERTYGTESWRRADGEPDGVHSYGGKRVTKPCEHSVMGIVVAGPGRGEAFRVCVAKKKCKVHWSAAMKEAAKKGGTSAAAERNRYAEQERRREEEHRKAQVERDRWKKALPDLLDALREELNDTPPLELAEVLIEACRPWHEKDKGSERPVTLEDLVRYVAYLAVVRELGSDWNLPHEAPRVLKRFGLDAKSIVDQVAPKEKPAKAKKAARKKATAGVCRECGCTDDDCTDCVERTGEPCTWVEPDLCSACAPAEALA